MTWVWVETFTADANGQVIIASLPFAEAPFARVTKTTADGLGIASIVASRPQPLVADPGWMKTNRVAAWRMNAQSVTCEYTGTQMNCSGNTLAATFQPTIDTKTWLNANRGITGYSRIVDQLPLNFATIQSQARDYHTGPTYQGTYLVSRHVDAGLPFTYRDQDINKAHAGFWVADQNVTYEATTAFISTDETKGVEIMDSENHGIPVTAPSRIEMGVTYFDGLQAGSTITAKFVESIEVIIKPGSSLAGLSDIIPARNYQFLQALSRSEATRNHGTADMNSWGSFFEGLKKAWDVLTPISEVVAEVLPPQYAAPLKVINGVNSKLRKATGAKQSPPKQIVDQASLPVPPKPQGRVMPRW